MAISYVYFKVTCYKDDGWHTHWCSKARLVCGMTEELFLEKVNKHYKDTGYFYERVTQGEYELYMRGVRGKNKKKVAWNHAPTGHPYAHSDE